MQETREHFTIARGRRFPTLAIALLVVGVIWLLNDLKIVLIDIPWIPVVLIIIAMGMIFNRFLNKW